MYFQSFPSIQYDLEGNQNYYTLKNLSVFADLKSKFIDDYSAYVNYAIRDGERPDLVSYKLYGQTKYYWTFMLLNDNIQNIWLDWPKSDYVMSRYIDNLYKGKYAFLSNNSFVGKMNAGRIIGSNIFTSAKATIVDKNVNLGYIEVEYTSDSTGTFGNQGQTIVTADSLTPYETLGVSSFVSMKNAPHHYLDENGNIRFKKASNYTIVTNQEFLIDENNEKNLIKVFKPDYVQEVERQFKRIISNGTINV